MTMMIMTMTMIMTMIMIITVIDLPASTMSYLNSTELSAPL
jgi:hypothetical protein